VELAGSRCIMYDDLMYNPSIRVTQIFRSFLWKSYQCLWKQVVRGLYRIRRALATSVNMSVVLDADANCLQYFTVATQRLRTAKCT